MNLHEYQAKLLLEKFNLPVPHEIYINELPQLQEAWSTLADGKKGAVLKAQLHAGGRGKAGGVKVLDNIQEAETFVRNLLGSRLKTYQTGPEGQPVSGILVCENIYPVRQELYLGAVVDRDSRLVTFIASPEGGVEIEKVAQETPQKIAKVSIDPLIGVQPCHVRQLASVLQLEKTQLAEFGDLLNNAWRAFTTLDFSLLEINPLVIRHDGGFMCADAKITIDDNALYRQPALAAMRDETQEDARERAAAALDLNYVALEGNIGCMVNGAGLAMATMDIIKLYGGDPANFLDVGGGATQERVTEAFKLISSDTRVSGILVNIFGGIVRCDMIAKAIINALLQEKITLPVVARLSGNHAAEGMKLLQESGMEITPVHTLDEAARAIIAVVNK
ncbi:ADP-forming succinate--CoA ligase subunit beta [Brenneria populi subsp. brevivirga]|uniref:ADP-forming succinate--CoA ligase subunit beta n=1 Tax=Brenneria populi TaxID=1505588 RepID=UPI002E199317|nr:ADP-forming succinate--CoA ligase subunit beta [Brenneria populi subsp. brevivirga]